MAPLQGGSKYGLQVSKTQIDRATLVFIQFSNVVYQNFCLLMYFKKKKLGGSKIGKKGPKFMIWHQITKFFWFCFFFTTLDPLKKNCFLNALGLPHILVKSFWKSGKNWNFGEFFNILTFSSFFSNNKIIIRRNSKKLKY